MGLLERLGLPSRQAANQSNTGSENSAHFALTRSHTKKTVLSGEDTATRNVLVALHADEMDDELVRLGCLMAKVKKGRVETVHKNKGTHWTSLVISPFSLLDTAAWL